MAQRPISAVPNIFASEGAGTLNNIPLLDADFAAIVSQNNDSAIGYNNYFADTGVANAYVLTLPAAPSAYIAGMEVTFTPANTNTGASTININALGAVSINNPADVALNGGEISANASTLIVYDGNSFRLIGQSPLSVTLPGLAAGTTINCAGATSVFAKCTFTSASGGVIQVNLTHLGYGVPVVILVTNSTGTAANFSFGMTDPGGASVATIFQLQSGTTTGGSLGGFPVAMAGGATMSFSGATIVGGQGLFYR